MVQYRFGGRSHYCMITQERGRLAGRALLSSP